MLGLSATERASIGLIGLGLAPAKETFYYNNNWIPYTRTALPVPTPPPHPPPTISTDFWDLRERGQRHSVCREPYSIYSHTCTSSITTRFAGPSHALVKDPSTEGFCQGPFTLSKDMSHFFLSLLGMR